MKEKKEYSQKSFGPENPLLLTTTKKEQATVFFHPYESKIIVNWIL